MTRTTRRLLVVVVAGVAVFAAFSIQADISSLGARLAGYRWWTFGLGLLLATSNYMVRFGRWSRYLALREIRVARRRSIQIFLCGFALSVTPGKVGELVKCYLLRETDAVPVARSAPIVVAERIGDLVALLALALVGVALYGVATSLVAGAAACLAAGFAILAWPRATDWIIDLISRPRRLRGLATRLREFHGGLIDLLRPQRLAWATGVAAIAWLAECLGFALIIHGFPGTDVPFGLAMLIYASTTLAGAFSFLPGGLGVTEAGMTWFLIRAGHGVDHPTAVAATILTRLATLWFAVVIGLFALHSLRRGTPSARRALDGDPANDVPLEPQNDPRREPQNDGDRLPP